MLCSQETLFHWLLRGESSLSSHRSLNTDSLNSLLEELLHTWTHTCQERKVCVMKTCLWSDSGCLPPTLFAQPHGSYFISQQAVFFCYPAKSWKETHLFLYIVTSDQLQSFPPLSQVNIEFTTLRAYFLPFKTGHMLKLDVLVKDKLQLAN